MRRRDAIVVGSGPNGLAAGIALAQAARTVLLIEASNRIGGGARSAEITLPGFVHDICSAIHPLAVGAPFFPTLPLHRHGLRWIESPAALAHPFDDGTAAVLERSIAATAASLGPDARAYSALSTPLARDWPQLARDLLGPPRLPRHPVAMMRFARHGLCSARALAERQFQGHRAQALFAGLAAHSGRPLESAATAAFGLVLGIAAHAVGWPFPAHGTQSIADALGAHLHACGGEIITGQCVETLDQLPDAAAVLLDLTPRQVLRIAGGRLSAVDRRRFEKHRYGCAAFKVDWALDGPIPWTAAACRRAATIHLGGTLAEIAAAEAAVHALRHPPEPFVLLTQPSLFDATRAPEGKHTAWAYCHVPNGSTVDMTVPIESQLERFAPGFTKRILARAVSPPTTFERYNPNYIGGDIFGGAQDIRQLLLRPALRRHPYGTSAQGLFICSSSVPPGAGVHGMCGYFAAQAALRYLRRG